MGKLMATVEALQKELEECKSNWKSQGYGRGPAKGTGDMMVAPVFRGAFKTGSGDAKPANVADPPGWWWTGGYKTNGANLYIGTSTLSLYSDSGGIAKFTQDYHQHYKWPGHAFNSVSVTIVLSSADGGLSCILVFQSPYLGNDQSDAPGSWSGAIFSPPVIGGLGTLEHPPVPVPFVEAIPAFLSNPSIPSISFNIS
jgi:hypothetical protein